MPTRRQVLTLLDEGHSYESAGRQLKVRPGQAFMIATGLPADGSDSPHPDELEGRPALPASSQHLVNPTPVNPTRNQQVIDWVRDRATTQLRQDA
jgi:hypothetical protein